MGKSLNEELKTHSIQGFFSYSNNKLSNIGYLQ